MSDSEDDFFALLGKSISKPVEKKENICLISLEQLEPDCVKLECGHCFNYMPLFEEYKVQILNISNTINKHRCFSCPYCRKKQKEVLPMKEGVKYNYAVHYPLERKGCEWVFKTGKRKNDQCSSISKGIYDEKYYCSVHCTSAMKQVKKPVVKKVVKKVVGKKKAENVVVEDENVVVEDENVVVEDENVVVAGQNIVVIDTLIENNVDKMLDNLMSIFKEDKSYILQELCNIMKITYNNKDQQYVKPAIVGLMANLKLFFGKNIYYMDDGMEKLESVDVSELDDLKMKLKLTEGDGVKLVGKNIVHKMTENSVVIPLRNLSKLFEIEQVGSTLKLEVKMADYIKMMNTN
jgi:hypothetical protein